MMREITGERKSGTLGQRRFRDFRETLVSIFVDNLNHQVDQRFLWDLFKVFGRMRDIYLSAATVHMKIGYAFVRFGTIEEAKRVAETMNGMYVFGWPIRATVAKHGWKSRNLANTGDAIRHRMQTEDDKKVSLEGKGHRGSYADVLKEKSEVRGVREGDHMEMLKLVITGSSFSDSRWLENSAMGVMMGFTNVSRVKRRLFNRGFSFTTKYLGGRAILWSFNSSQDCEGFISNSFFWNDMFSSVQKWSGVRSFDDKPVWFNFTGVALDYWTEAFFKKLVSKLGELALVDEEMLLRKRLDSARLLLLIPPNRSLPKVIQVVDGFKHFSVSVEAESRLRDMRWINDFLGLNQEFEILDRGCPSMAEETQLQNQVGRRSEAVFEILSNHSMGKVSSEPREFNQRGKEDVEVCRDNSKETFLQEKSTIKSRRFRQVRGKDRVEVNRKWTLGEESSSSAEDEIEEGQIFFSEFPRGECSKKVKALEWAVEDGLGERRTPANSPTGSDLREGLNDAVVEQVEGLCLDGHMDNLTNEALLELALVDETRRVERMREWRKCLKAEDRSRRHGVSIRSSIKGTKKNNSREDGQCVEVEEGSNEDGNMVAKIAKVVERADRRGHDTKGNRILRLRDLTRKLSCDGGSQTGLEVENTGEGFHQDVEEEIVKVIKTGVSLGIDFNGKIMEMEEVIAICEKEEKDRTAETRKRGLGRDEKKRVIQSLVCRHKPMIFFIQEMKLKAFDSSVERGVSGPKRILEDKKSDFRGTSRQSVLRTCKM
ncbi:hypothetical protein Dsin_027814 [Dipteronia sinensis]|uniref:RRM domain-containing protein n=1 Tax=Dipteronia sinensis TaxID=43782 RepID=A0AAD9ZPG8_9ROSI|nr:hypothetical protein Dsin_027814 [Dipteronia sinensis]